MKSISNFFSACGLLASVVFAVFGIRSIGFVNATGAAIPQMGFAESEVQTLKAWLEACRMAWEANLVLAGLFIVVVSLNMVAAWKTKSK